MEAVGLLLTTYYAPTVLGQVGAFYSLRNTLLPVDGHVDAVSECASTSPLEAVGRQLVVVQYVLMLYKV